MDAKTLKEIRAALSLGAGDMAQLLGIMPRTYYRYEGAQTKIPLTVERYLITLLKYPNVRNDAILAVRGNTKDSPHA